MFFKMQRNGLLSKSCEDKNKTFNRLIEKMREKKRERRQMFDQKLTRQRIKLFPDD